MDGEEVNICVRQVFIPWEGLGVVAVFWKERIPREGVVESVGSRITPSVFVLRFYFVSGSFFEGG